MNKKIMLVAGAIALFSVTLFACPKMQCHQNMGCQSKSAPMMKNSLNHFERFKKNVMRLDLSQTQREAIKALFISCKESRANPYDAFSETEFDKEKYKELVKENKATKLERRAETMAKVHALLTPSQKKELYVVLNLKSVMMEKKKNYCDK